MRIEDIASTLARNFKDKATEHNQRLWRQLGLGGGLGLATGLLWWWGVSAYCGANRRACDEFNWSFEIIHPLDVFVIGALLTLVIILMINIHGKSKEQK